MLKLRRGTHSSLKQKESELHSHAGGDLVGAGVVSVSLLLTEVEAGTGRSKKMMHVQRAANDALMGRPVVRRLMWLQRNENKLIGRSLRR